MPKKEKKYSPFDDPNHPMYRARPREDGRSKRKVKISGSFTSKPKIKEPKRLSNTKNYESRMRSRGKKVEEFSVGGIAKKVVKTILRDDYKPKLKNEKEVYSRVKQDYSDVIKNYEKTQKRKKRNRAAAVVGGAATAVAIQSKKDKQNKK